MSEPINLFWTGGWDSSYRLFHLLLVEERTVQPYYVIDSSRKSLQREFQALDQMKRRLAQQHPAARRRLRPMQIVALTDIPPHRQISDMYLRLKARTDLSGQYRWLARFAHHAGLDDVELCLTNLPPSEGGELRELMLPDLVGEGHDCRLREPLSEPDLAIFRYFRFPTIHQTKLQMEEAAIAHGFRDLLALSWFCLAPVRGLPCGRCYPCGLALASGRKYDYPFATDRRSFAWWWRLSQRIEHAFWKPETAETRR